MFAIIGSKASINAHFAINYSKSKTNVAKVAKIGFYGSMTGTQFNQWRIDHGLTLREVATDYLGGEVTHTAVSKWERSPADIPQWAADKILGKTIIKLPIDELHELLDAAREDGKPAQEMIAQALREYLQNRQKLASTLPHDSSPAPTLPPCPPSATSANSTAPSPTSPPIPPMPANIVQLPPPPVMSTLMHDSLPSSTKPAQTPKPSTTPKQA